MEEFLGLPLECFKDGVNDKEVLVCLDERGERFEYRGVQNSNSTTTMYGRWTGPAAYFDDLPVKVLGNHGKQTSALDSFSMLYAIQCETWGHHNESVNEQYVRRINAALQRGVISSFRDMNEFKVATRIVDSFARTGHLFDVLTDYAEMSYAARLGAVHGTAKWIAHDASMTFPVFDFTDDERASMKELHVANPRVSVEKLEDVIEFLESGGLGSSYACVWLKDRLYKQMQAEKAWRHVRDVIEGERVQSDVIPSWRSDKKSYVKVGNAVTIESVEHDITASILESLL